MNPHIRVAKRGPLGSLVALHSDDYLARRSRRMRCDWSRLMERTDHFYQVTLYRVIVNQLQERGLAVLE